MIKSVCTSFVWLESLFYHLSKNMIANNEDDENNEFDEFNEFDEMKMWECEKNFRTMYFTSIRNTFTFIYSRQMNIFYEFVRVSFTSF
jgi:hypothetical protein